MLGRTEPGLGSALATAWDEGGEVVLWSFRKLLEQPSPTTSLPVPSPVVSSAPSPAAPWSDCSCFYSLLPLLVLAL